MRIKKKEYDYFLKWYSDIINNYNPYTEEEKSIIDRTLLMLGIKKEVENDLFKDKNKKYNYQLSEIERIIKKQYNKKVDFKSLDMYQEEIPYMSNLNDEDKKILNACINLLI